MYSLALLGFSSFLLALFLTPVVRNLSWRWGLVDEPGEERRVHTSAVPRVGGVAIFVAYLGAFGILLLSDLAASRFVLEASPVVERLFPAAAVIFLTGLLDDLVGLKPWQKLLGQLLAAGLAIWGGVAINGVAAFDLPAWAAIPLTVVWLVGCANAFNLIDGMDGLATGIGLFATITMLLAAFTTSNVPLAMAVIPLAGALLGFLRYNFNPATIFLGDCGSLSIGFVLGCLGVLWSQKSATVLGMTAPLMALAVPLLDTGISMARRFLRGRKVWDADRGHIHHRLLDRGFTPRKAALLLYSAAGVGAVLSVVQSSLQDSFGGLIVILFCVAAWIGIQHLGYVEFGVAGRMFVDGAFRRHLSYELQLKGFESRLQEAVSGGECWAAIDESARAFGYDRVRARLWGETFLMEGGNGTAGWTIRIPLPGNDYVNLVRAAGAETPLARVGPFADAIQRIMEEKLDTGAGLKALAAAVGQGAGSSPAVESAPAGLGAAPMSDIVRQRKH